MGNIKIHEIAKELGVNSKEVLEKARNIGIEVKSHLSSVDEETASKIRNNFKAKKETVEAKTVKENKKEVVEKKPKDAKKDKKSQEEHVIIRREVIISEENKNPENEKSKNNKNSGFSEQTRNKDYNIVYRNKQTRPMTVNELFGISKKKEEKPKAKEEVEQKEVIKKEEQVKPEPAKPQEIVKKEEKAEVKETVKKVENMRENNRNFDNNNNRKNNNYNNSNNNERRNNYSQNRNNNGRFQNDRNGQGRRDNTNNFGNNNNRNFRNNRNNNGNNNYNNQRRPLDEKGIEKNIKNIMSVDVPEKESVREYANKAIDKQKINRAEDRTKKPQKNKKNDKANINKDKLKNLTKENKLSHMFNEGSMYDYYDLSTNRVRKNKKKNQKMSEDGERNKQKIFKLTEITIPETVSVKDLATELKKTSSEVIKKLLGYGIMATINNELDFDTAFLVAGEFGVTAKKKEVVKEEDILFDESEDKADELISRPPVIVVMGHVDHGKTSLLDAIRSTNVIEGEAGGITQHIGAYKVNANGREITFLDTPGHEAFTSMRARGAQITDIAILVVAANDGVMPQTVEAINHAKAAGIPIIVAVNKIDLEGANVERIKQELTEYGLVPEEWGGDTVFVPISAKKRQNIDTLLEMVLLVADMQDLKVNPNKQAKGTIIEAKLDKAKGVMATMLVQRGKLDVGDTIVVGSVIGRIRAMTNDKGQKVKSAGPSTPVEITGLPEVPSVGETFYEVKDEKMAKHLIERRKRQQREKELNASSRVTLDDLFSKIEKENLKQLNLIVKADVQGSVEALKQSLEKLSNDEVRVQVIHANVGAVTESDVTLAKVSNAIIIAFNVRPDSTARDVAEKEEVEIKTYSVIYSAIDDVQLAMKGMLDPVYKEVITGNAEVRQTFKVSNVGTIAGCYVTNGKIPRNAIARVIRDNVVIFEGKIASLKRFKDDAKEVASGYECGLQLEGYNDLKEGDIIEAHIMEEIK